MMATVIGYKGIMIRCLKINGSEQSHPNFKIQEIHSVLTGLIFEFNAPIIIIQVLHKYM